MIRLFLLVGLAATLSGCFYYSAHGRFVGSMSNEGCWSRMHADGQCENSDAKEVLRACAIELDERSVAAKDPMEARQQLFACMSKKGWNHLQLV